MKYIYLLLIYFMICSNSKSACICVCLDGVFQSACNLESDIPKICPRKSCPSPTINQPSDIVIPSTKPICVPDYSYNVYTGKYQRTEKCY